MQHIALTYLPLSTVYIDTHSVIRAYNNKTSVMFIIPAAGTLSVSKHQFNTSYNSQLSNKCNVRAKEHINNGSFHCSISVVQVNDISTVPF